MATCTHLLSTTEKHHSSPPKSRSRHTTLRLSPPNSQSHREFAGEGEVFPNHTAAISPSWSRSLPLPPSVLTSYLPAAQLPPTPRSTPHPRLRAPLTRVAASIDLPPSSLSHGASRAFQSLAIGSPSNLRYHRL